MKKFITIVFLLLVLQPAIFAEEKEKADHVEQGKAHFKSAFYQLTPKHRKEEAAKQYALAIREFKKAIAANPDNEAAYRHLARLYMVQERSAEAAVAYQKVIALNPVDGDVYLRAASALYQSEQYREAIKTLQAAKGLTDDKFVLAKIDEYIATIEGRISAGEVSDAK